MCVKNDESCRQKKIICHKNLLSYGMSAMSWHVIAQRECASKSALISDIELTARLFNCPSHILQLLSGKTEFSSKWKLHCECTQKNSSTLIISFPLMNANNNNDNKSTLISLQIKEYVLLLRENSKTC